MQWLLFVVTLIVTAILQRLARASGAQIPVEARATLALGLLLLAAYVAGTLTHRLRLPRITGYLVAGLVAGPAWLGLIRFDELEVLSIVSNGALSLIAFGAGSQLSLGTLRGVNRRPLLHVMATALAVPFLLVTVVMLTVSPWFPLTAHQPFRDALVIALVLGAFATIGSPTLTWALMNDVGARREGPLSRSLVDVTILSTIAATVLVLVVLAIARPVASRGAVIPGSTMRAVLLLAASVAAGTVLGVLLAQYLRSSAIRVTWALVAVAFIIAQTMRLAGLDTVLVALTAGCAVRNLASNEHARLDVELERCAVPVHVVFFALAGAALSFDPLTALGLWPWAVLLVALRINGLRWAFQLAGRWRGEAGGAGGELSRYGWLGLVSQGGMAITLAAVLRNAFPEWNVSLEALLVAMIGLHMLAGPICFQWALRRTGEVTEGRGEFDAPQTALVADGDSLVSRV
jgi:Kef-type K+ transport system membrane component KefB